jgi:S-methylmethionine-dependent homocysteine/selenocysteine methylase
VTPAEFAVAAKTWVEHGAALIGGCCGAMAPHIAAVSGTLTDA